MNLHVYRCVVDIVAKEQCKFYNITYHRAYHIYLLAMLHRTNKFVPNSTQGQSLNKGSAKSYCFPSWLSIIASCCTGSDQY